MSGGRLQWKWDDDLPSDLVTTPTALKLVGRKHPNVLWHRRETGRLRAYNLGHAIGWSLAELAVLLKERDRLTLEQALARVTAPEVRAQIVDLRSLPPDPISPDQARRILGVGQSWFREQVAAGRIPFSVVAGQRVFSKQQLLGLPRRRAAA